MIEILLIYFYLFILICPKCFWYKCPLTRDWIIANDAGDFNFDQFRNLPYA